MPIRPDTTTQIAIVQNVAFSVGNVMSIDTALKVVTVHSTDLQGVWTREGSAVTLYPWHAVMRMDVTLGQYATIGDLQEHA